MAKLFRKFREQMISEKKVKNYFFYAIGEIILVVIGILVALQINSINQDHQRSKLEKVLLGQARFELLEIYEDIWRDAENLELGNQSHYTLQEYINQDLAYNDSLCFNFYWLKVDEYVYPTSAAYSRIKEEGLDIIQNDTIRIALQALYEGHFPRMSKNNANTLDISSVFDDYYMNTFRPNTDLTLSFAHKLKADTVGRRIYTDVDYVYPSKDRANDKENTIGYVPLDFKSLKGDPKFLMLLEQTNRFRNSKLRHYSAVKTIIKLAVNIIERELDIDDSNSI